MVHKVRPVKIPVKPTTPSSAKTREWLVVTCYWGCWNMLAPRRAKERGWAITPIYVPFFLFPSAVTICPAPLWKEMKHGGFLRARPRMSQTVTSHFSCLLHPLSGRKIYGRNLAQRGQGALTKLATWGLPLRIPARPYLIWPGVCKLRTRAAPNFAVSTPGRWKMFKKHDSRFVSSIASPQHFPVPPDPLVNYNLLYDFFLNGGDRAGPPSIDVVEPSDERPECQQNHPSFHQDGSSKAEQGHEDVAHDHTSDGW